MKPIQYPIADPYDLTSPQRAFLEAFYLMQFDAIEEEGPPEEIKALMAQDIPLIIPAVVLANTRWGLARDTWMKAQEQLGIIPEGTFETERAKAWEKIHNPLYHADHLVIRMRQPDGSYKTLELGPPDGTEVYPSEDLGFKFEIDPLNPTHVMVVADTNHPSSRVTKALEQERALADQLSRVVFTDDEPDRCAGAPFDPDRRPELCDASVQLAQTIDGRVFRFRRLTELDEEAILAAGISCGKTNMSAYALKRAVELEIEAVGRKPKAAPSRKIVPGDYQFQGASFISNPDPATDGVIPNSFLDPTSLTKTKALITRHEPLNPPGDDHD